MKFLKILILFFPLLSNAQFTQSFDWKKIIGNVPGGGSNSVLTIDETSNTISLSFACSFSSISIPNKHVVDIDYPLNLPNMILGNINSSTGVSTYQIVILNNKIYLYSTSNEIINSMNGTLSSSLLNYTPIDNTALSSFGQISQNYIKTTTYNSTSGDSGSKNIEILYFDGLGRPIQKIDNALSNSGKDIITTIKYDALGRQTKDFLPYPSTQNNLNYIDITNFESEITNYYQANYGDNNPYSEKLYESTLLDRVIKISAPGNDWVMGGGKEIKFDYQTNGFEEVKYFKVSASWDASKELYEPAIVQTGYYSENELFKTITKDENWKATDGKNNTTEEFKDKEGRVVLKRTYNNGDKHDTYYIYDQYGNLTYVIPPLAEGIASEDNLNYLGYQYKYDSRNRLVEKKLPGKQWEFIVYDKLDRPVATGPAFSPYGDQNIGWMITEYDVFGRVTQTGWKAMSVSETDRNSNQTTINSGTNPFTLGTNDILTQNFYDNYNFAGAPSPLPTPIENQTLATNVKGMPTGSWVKVLDNATSTTAEVSYTLYDNKYRPIHTKTTNYLGGYTQVDTHLDWAGKTLYTLTKHKRTNADTELVVKDMFTYTDQDRLALHKQKINQLPEQLIAKNTYDELGQLISKNVGGTDVTGALGLQKVDYSYNIRGWLNAINDVNTIGNDLFAFKINYNTPETATPLFNGNISETFWNSSADNIIRKYDYTYDHLNRLLKADYSKDGSTSFNSYLEHLTYDKNGNIQSLLRNGDMDTDGLQFENPIDHLTYMYDTDNKNQLLRVFDATANPQGFKDDTDGTNINLDISEAPDYRYDANGNMIEDKNKGITSIIYNHLNLPTKIVFNNSEATKITYLYNAKGQKIKKTVTQRDVVSTEYLSSFQYKNAALQFFPHAEGYVNATENVTIGGGASYTFNYVFNFTDHLGNIRLSYSKDPATNVLKIIEENHYYPFGLKHTGYNSDRLVYSRENQILKIRPVPPLFVTSYNYRFVGREQQDELGLNVTAMDFRQYDNALGRFLNPDRLAELAFDQTPYRYAYNNPMFYKDPSGLYEVDANGNIKITDTDEIKKFMGYLNHNQKASVNDMAEHIFNADNGYSYQLEEVVIKGRSEGAWAKGMSQARANQARAANAISSFSGNVSIGNHEINDFDKGFIGADESNFMAVSAWTGYAGLHLNKTESLLKYVGATDDVLKVTKSLGTKLGAAGVVFTVLEDFKDNKQGTGTVVKAAIGTLSVIFPGAGLAYAIIDLSVGVATGTTLTDRIANGVEQSLKD